MTEEGNGGGIYAFGKILALFSGLTKNLVFKKTENYKVANFQN